MKPEIIVLIGTLGGAFLGFLTSIITILVNRHYENKKSYQEALLTAAIKHWEATKEAALRGQIDYLYPLDTFILHYAKIIRMISENKLDKENIEKTIKECDEIYKIYSQSVIKK